MKKNNLPITFLLCFTFILVFSCHKKSDPINYGIKFDGHWTGINSCDSSIQSINIVSPVNNVNAVFFTSHTDTGFCSKSITLYGMADGNNVTFPAAVYEDSCGNGYTISLSGTIVGVTLVLTRITSGTISDTCIFTATK